jgi:ubiquinone biosynthesis protein UbiJ
MSASRLTQHAIMRMSQRGIRLDDLELAELIGTEGEGGCLVRRKDVQAFERDVKRVLDKVRGLEGKRIVRPDDALVTASHASRAKERRLLRRG